MIRWTVYDRKTGETLLAQAGGDDEVVENPSAGADALTSALSDPAAVAIVPARTPGQAVVLTMRRPQGGMTYEPTGFLGVHDQVVLDPQAPAGKPWWKKLLG